MSENNVLKAKKSQILQANAANIFFYMTLHNKANNLSINEFDYANYRLGRYQKKAMIMVHIIDGGLPVWFVYSTKITLVSQEIQVTNIQLMYPTFT